jgi:BirA family biotin operon repressor/biotin-[acetyl-CoA-carboxylase] ligase
MSRPASNRSAKRRAQVHRRDLTISEARLWGALKGKALGVRFRRQVPIGMWIVDFACFDPKVVIEVDGESHEYRDERLRSDYIKSLGFRVLRFDNLDVAFALEHVLAQIQEVVSEPEWRYDAFPPP